MALALAVTPAPAGQTEDSAAIEARQAESRAEYDRVAREMALSSEKLEKLAAEIATVKKDHATITAALIQAAKTEKKLGDDIEDITDRLEGLKDQQEGIRQSLAARRDVLAEVLGALQRIGLNPPPALLVKPEDALSSVRSAILLGAVVPELRSETEILLADLKEMTRITASIEAERQRLGATVADQVAEKERLNLLLAAKSRLQDESETALASEQQRSEELAAKAGSLKDLIASLEKDIVGARSAEEKARRAEEEREEARSGTCGDAGSREQPASRNRTVFADAGQADFARCWPSGAPFRRRRQ